MIQANMLIWDRNPKNDPPKGAAAVVSSSITSGVRMSVPPL